MDDVSGGYIKLHRALMGSEIWGWPERYMKFWIYLLLNARWTPTVVAGVEVGVGQYLRSYRQMADDCVYLENRQEKRWSTSVVKRMVDRFEGAGMIRNLSTEHCTLIEVCNFKQWQGLTGPQNGTGEQPENRTAERDRRTTGEHPEAKDLGGFPGYVVLNLERDHRTTGEQPENNNKKVEEGVRSSSLSTDEPPKLKTIYVQELVAKHGIDVQLEWAGFTAYVESTGRRYDNVEKAWESWIVKEARQRERGHGRVKSKKGSKKPWEE